MTTQVDPFALVPPQVIQHWGIFLGMGMGMICLAILAWLRSARASIESVYFFGWLFMVASAIEAFDAYMTGGWSGFYLHLVETGRIRVLGGVVDLRIESWTECWIPSSECILPLFVEYAGSNLEQKMCSALTPRHLLAFYHPLADDLIDC
jgi:hypothetical protein